MQDTRSGLDEDRMQYEQYLFNCGSFQVCKQNKEIGSERLCADPKCPHNQVVEVLE